MSVLCSNNFSDFSVCFNLSFIADGFASFFPPALFIVCIASDLICSDNILQISSNENN